MKIFRKAKKKRGEYRVIYAPNAEESAAFRVHLGPITRKAEKACPEGVAHGFLPMRSPVTNALAHVGHAYTLCMDLEDFFDSVTESQIKGLLSKDEIAAVLIDGAPRQGLPTSPSVANLAASKFDKAVLKWRDKHKAQMVYTRYADDLSFSFDDAELAGQLQQVIPQIAGRMGWSLNRRKTRLMWSGAGRRVITGIAVGDTGIHVPRWMRRRLRAARHQAPESAHTRGLEEWCRMREPKKKIRRKTGAVDGAAKSELEALAKEWRIKLPPIPPAAKDEVWLREGDVVLTGDPAYTLGMSTYTNGWTSCMAQPNGQYRKGAPFWLYLRGSRICALLHERTTTFAGVTRRQMKARALVHELRCGVLVHDRIYGNPSDIAELRRVMQSKGVISMESARKKHKDEKVVGHVPVSAGRPYFDNLRSAKSKAAAGPHKGNQIWVAKI